MNRTKLLLDTDIGDDIDDALALALALALPEAELVGVTTVYCNTGLRARLAKKILTVAGCGAPVYAGCGHSLAKENDTSFRFCQYTEDLNAPRFAPENGADEEAAVKFIVDSAKKFGKELVVVGIGPLTNLAKAIRQDMDAMRGVKKIVIMGGAFYSQFREWNIVCDPEAAKIVFESGCPLECVGVDVTGRVQLSRLEHDYILAQREGVNGCVAELVRLWTEVNRRECLLHDPLALYYALHPEILFMEETGVYVETEGKCGRGMTVNLNAQYFGHGVLHSGRILVARDVKEKEFMEIFMERLYGCSARGLSERIRRENHETEIA